MFGYEIWYEGNCIRSNDGYETEEEAEEEARVDIADQINDWKLEGAYHGETEDDFEIRII